ncbi:MULTISPECIES: hypothetical protein [unclassified Streptomyces]|uniref:hypothetical protein n=1 Tax=unclassified Streptomyces TaxID=2593676 RepID=UPI0033EE5267
MPRLTGSCTAGGEASSWRSSIMVVRWGTRRLLPPKPTGDAAFGERVLWTMRKNTVAMAGIPAKTSAACDGCSSSLWPGHLAWTARGTLATIQALTG